MTYRGVARGSTIELDEPLPYADGQAVNVRVEPASDFRKGDPQAVLEAVRAMPPLSGEDVDALERAIEEGRLPVRYEGVFDAEDA
jgi:hypothetical protein